MKFILSSALLVLLTMHQVAQSQSEIPACRTMGSDPDLDGYGWEYQHRYDENLEYPHGNAGAWTTCAVTDESPQKPEFINRQTGLPVNLVRAYWDPNKDIADKSIHCSWYGFNSTSGEYEKNTEINGGPVNLWHLQDTLHYHRPLPDSAPYYNNAHMRTVDYLNSNGLNALTAAEEWGMFYVPLWGVHNGIYSGTAPLAASPYLEIVDLPSGDASAVRIWTNDNYVDGYYQCADHAGGSLVPTGAPNVAGSPLDTLPELLVTLTSPAIDNDAAILNRETSTEVELDYSTWNFNKDLATRQIHCETYTWRETSGTYIQRGNDDSEWSSEAIYLVHPYNGGDYALVSNRTYNDGSHWETERVSIADSHFKWVNRTTESRPVEYSVARIEHKTNGVPFEELWFWDQDGSQYDRCTTTEIVGRIGQSARIFDFNTSGRAINFSSSVAADTTQADTVQTDTVQTDTGNQPQSGENTSNENASGNTPTSGVGIIDMFILLVAIPVCRRVAFTA